MDDNIDQLRPELSPFCDYVRSFFLSVAQEDEDLNWEFIAKETLAHHVEYELLVNVMDTYANYLIF